ncbi:MAG: hypothetical protein AAF682_29030 [Planctomycetota bacterium]
MSRAPHRGRGGGARALAKGAAALALLGFPSTASDAEPAPDPRVAARELLAEPPAAWNEVPALQDALVALGAGALPELCDALGQADLGAPGEVAVRGVFARLPRADVAAFFEARAAEPRPAAERALDVELLAHGATPDELGLLLRLAPESSAQHIVEPEVRDELRDGLTSVLARHPDEAPAELARRLAGAHPSLHSAAVQALGSARPDAALEALADVVRGVPPAAPRALVELRNVIRGDGPRPSDRALTALRGTLWSTDPAARSMGALILAEVRDRESVPELIDLLVDSSDADERTLRDAALRALVALTGQRFGTDGAAWTRWYTAEHEWLAARAGSCAAAIRSGDAQRASDALRAVATHRLFADELVETVLPALGRREQHLVVLACGALGYLGSRGAIPGLLDALEHDAAAVRAAAHDALIEITSLRLPPDAARWRRELAPR